MEGEKKSREENKQSITPLPGNGIKREYLGWIGSWTGIKRAFCTGLHEMLEALYEFDKWTRLEIHIKQVHISLNREK